MDFILESTDFDELVAKSVKGAEHLKEHYFDDAYKAELIRVLKESNWYDSYSREIKEDSKNTKGPKMLSVASSSRLCFIYFYPQGVRFEEKVDTGLRGGQPQLDAYKDNVYYECKCHEIFASHDTLSNSYRDKLKEVFGINADNLDNDSYVKLSLYDFGIDDGTSIYDLHFDLKQMICHLLGLANSAKNSTLQYVFFTPKKEIIAENPECQKVYDVLNQEIEKIWNSPVIKNVCSTYGIKLPKPNFIEVSEIKDFILERL